MKPVEPEGSSVAADARVVELAALARGSLQGEPTRRDAASFARVGEKVVQKRRKTRRVRAATSALTVAVAVLVSFATHTRALTYRVVNGAVVEGQRVIAGAGTEVRFSDGSALVLTPGAETRIAELDAHGGRVRLDEGTAKVTIAKRPGAAWTLAAGPYSVRVTGTAFSLHWSARDEAFEIAMTSGAVVVTGPLINSGITLRAGQRLESSVKSGRLVVDGNSTPATNESDASAPLNPGPAASPSPDNVTPRASASDTVTPQASASDAVEGAAPSHPPALDWRKKAAQGDFADVIAAAERRGLESTLASAPLEDLAALADSARYARRSSLAKRALLAERARFPRSAAARDAAFFLGRIAEDEGTGASEWYDRYLSESSDGAYASQALGRKMMLVYQRGGATAAGGIATAYLEKYPSGAYSGTAKKISAEARSSAE
jgi:hypothetical protein